MIAYLEGTILFVHTDSLILKISSGVGYQIYVPSPLLQVQENQWKEYFVHSHNREGEITLFGFESFQEKRLFEMLIRTSGVGPKLGIAILSTWRPSELLTIIYNQDIVSLNAVSGVGKKTATKLSLDMSDLLKNHPIDLIASQASTITNENQINTNFNDLISALRNMGFAEKEIISILPQVQKEKSSLEDQLRLALKMLTVK